MLLFLTLACALANSAGSPSLPASDAAERTDNAATILTPAPWPASTESLTVLPSPSTIPARPFRLFLDAGHGEPTNSGNQSAACEAEQDTMLAIADDLAARLSASPHLQIQRSRSGDARPVYSDRIKQAEAWPADLILSLHSDARGGINLGRSAEGCYQIGDSAGFSVLWGDDEPSGTTGLAARRRDYGTVLSDTLIHAGFTAYDGNDYVGLYQADTTTRGLFLDTHTPKRRIRMLRRPRVPSLILETHNALDPVELLRWREEKTLASLASVLENIGAKAHQAGLVSVP